MNLERTLTRSTYLAGGALALALLPGCLGGEGKAAPDASVSTGPDGGGGSGPDASMAGPGEYPGGRYRTLEPDESGNGHPGCSTEWADGAPYEPAQIEGYPCAAKEYGFPEGVSEDPSKPIVILIHGNSDSPTGWESFVHPNPGSLGQWADTEARDQLATVLPAAGYRTIAVDLRKDLIDDPGGEGGNPSQNMDHGWAVPIAQRLIKAVIENNPEREVAVVGFSLGATVVRDSLRRLWVQWQDEVWDTNVFAHVADVIAASGAHHGVSTFPLLCGENTTMAGIVTCEMGQRNQYSQTAFHEPLNGPAATGDGEAFGGWYETPCADGDYAFGTRGACGDNAVEYTTITMEDNDNGTQQDEFVSEHASRLYPTECANNVLNAQSAFDTSGYFLNAALRFHYGAVRSDTGIGEIQGALETDLQLDGCAAKMQDAPTGDAAPSYADALPTASQNTWDGETIPN